MRLEVFEARHSLLENSPVLVLSKNVHLLT